ncbi:APCL protein, partial [Eudromia elegans]|nr:APCL protein [Eudromia elegans]
MSGSIASYEQLVRQVEALKKENSHLRRELQDNSQHLSKLENETSDMKEVLKHLQGKLEQEARVMVSSGQTEVLEQLRALHTDISSLYNLQLPAAALAPELLEEAPRAKDGAGEPSRATLRVLEELDRERCFLLGEMEKEEKEKGWYYTQLQSLSKRLEELPRVETVSGAGRAARAAPAPPGAPGEGATAARGCRSRPPTAARSPRGPRAPQLCTKLPGLEEDGDLELPTHPDDGSLGSSKVEVVFWLLSMLATRDKEDMSRTLLAMSSSQESCVAMRKSGCLPLLVQILHDAAREPGPPEPAAGAKDTRMRANAALHNIVFSQPDEGQAKKEMRVLHVLEQIRSYSETCWDWLQMQSREAGRGPEGSAAPVPIEPQICQATCAVMKLSFDEEYRRAMNELGGLQAVAELLQVDYEMHGMTSDPLNLALRRYAGMALTNLTFGDVANKATLCSRRGCMEAIVAQLASDSEELHQVVSSILRNLSWRADINSKKVLREVGSVAGLTQCALHAAKVRGPARARPAAAAAPALTLGSATQESTLKSVLSALWNLSAHGTENKAAICAVPGALPFLVSTLTYRCQSNSLAIIESGGGILRNVSSLVATREDYRQVLRDHNCLQTLLQHLRSHSLTIVSNACGTLWNLSARSARDQELLWDLGAVSMLRNLIHSKHKMIAMGSAAALRNLLANRPPKYKDAAVVSPGSCMPSLYVRKQKALEAELDAKHLAETFDTMEKQSLKSQSAKKPLRPMESLVKDYASDSGCFDDDEVPNVSSGVDTASASVLSMFLNSSFLQCQALPRALAQRRGPEPEKDMGIKPGEPRKPPLPEDDVSLAAEKLANKISSTVAKIDKLVEDISTMHTSSDDSFSLSSEDHGLEWQCGAEEARAQLPGPAEQESVQKYAVEDTPICFSRCSSLSSLSSADNALDGQSHSENDMESDSSLEILEMDEGHTERRRQRREKAADAGPAAPGGISQPISIPFAKRDKVFLREPSPSRHEDLTPSSSSENYVQETPLVMSRCSSVSSLGSFESASIASSIPSDPCSEMISGTISPSELPDSPGQTMPPSRSKTPLVELGSQPEKETSQFNLQWENNVKKFMEITDFKERFQLPQDLDSMVYFTVEKPNENFSCASSLSALPLHEHYVQKDVELKLMPPFPERNGLNFAAHEKREEWREERRRAERAEPGSDDDLEILKECISSAMPSRFRKVKPSLL